LALAGVLAGVVLFGVVLLSLFRRPPTSADAAPAGNQPEGSGGEQLQELRREKAELEARLGEMEGEVRRLLTDQQKLQEELAERSRIIQEKSRLIHELEATIQKASAEARAVQEEYAALYVRSAKEKKALQQA
jgi:peptidoglycan hydrolase CwlO-like protein